MDTADLSWPLILRKLTEQDDLSHPEVRWLVEDMRNEQATDAQIAACLVLLHTKGETEAELAAMTTVLLDGAKPLRIDREFIDVCGTGGSDARRSGAVNISTMSSFVIAAAGVPVCKHGGRAASSTSGSADLVDRLGIRVEMGEDLINHLLACTNWAFCYGPYYQPRLRRLGQIRRELQIRTTFNIVLPLVHPARPKYRLVGVSDRRHLSTMPQILTHLGTAAALVVLGHGSVDELTTSGPAEVAELRNGQVSRYTVDPAALGLRAVDAAQLAGGSPEKNREIADSVLAGQPSPWADMVALNAAAGLYVSEQVDGLEEGIRFSQEILASGRAREIVQDVRRRQARYSQRCE